jgi:hypothetical protein
MPHTPHTPACGCQPLDHLFQPFEALDSLRMIARKIKEMHPEFFRVKILNRFNPIRL